MLTHLALSIHHPPEPAPCPWCAGDGHVTAAEAREVTCRDCHGHGIAVPGVWRHVEHEEVFFDEWIHRA